jgi:diguanylate cyclase (GGDEF)-like protein/PAS domain S-box-containing protein
MRKKAKKTGSVFALDEFSIVIIGIGASVLYYIFEKVLNSSRSFTIFLTIAVILAISGFTQYLINRINRSKQELRIANDTLELKVKERTAELLISEAKYRTIFENTGTATIITQKDMTISLANSEFIKISGYEKHDIEGRKSWLDFIDDKSHRKLLSDGLLSYQGASHVPDANILESKFIDSRGQKKDVLISFSDIHETDNHVVSLADITQLKEAEKQIYFQAFHDVLTGLPNRALFMEYLNMAQKRGKRREDYLWAIIYMDIDRFKLVNDSLGHSVGDKLLIAFAEKIQTHLRDIDTLARLGGDEFVILLEDMEDIGYATRVTEKLQKSLQEPFLINGSEVFAPASFGIVINTKDYDLLENIIRDADAAMYHAKERGKAQFKIFDQTIHEKARHLLKIETDLRKAVDRGEFVLNYQPIVELDEKSIIGFEALIRWNHPHQGLIYPDIFIPVAEETGLIIPIGKWVLEEACRDLKRWNEHMNKIPPLFISVNISSIQLLKPDLETDIKKTLSKTGLLPQQLKLEITETALMKDTKQSINVISQLREFGVEIVIDDFGTGYSSMSYLQQLPIDTLKVDQSFVKKINEASEDNKKIVETIIDLARRLELNVVAEGVETKDQQSILTDLKCQLAQGYLFSKPLEKNKIDAIVDHMANSANKEPTFKPSLDDLLSV